MLPYIIGSVIFQHHSDFCVKWYIACSVVLCLLFTQTYITQYNLGVWSVRATNMCILKLLYPCVGMKCFIADPAQQSKYESNSKSCHIVLHTLTMMLHACLTETKLYQIQIVTCLPILCNVGYRKYVMFHNLQNFVLSNLLQLAVNTMQFSHVHVYT